MSEHQLDTTPITNGPTEQEKIAKYKLAVSILLITIFGFLSYYTITLSSKVKKYGIELTNLTQKNESLSKNLNTTETKKKELEGFVTEYNLKFQVIQTNLVTLNGLTENLKKSIDEKDVKINSLVNEKTALENDAKALRNTIVKMTAELAELGGELSKAKSENDENKLLSRINELTQERNALTTELKKYQTAIELLKKENQDLAAKMRLGVKETGYTFTTKVEESRKFGEVLIKLNIRDGGTTVELVNDPKVSKPNTDEPKSEKKSESSSKKGFWSKIFGPQAK
jgi:predicted  nucleic acid-binding Zn-ribbon protein